MAARSLDLIINTQTGQLLSGFNSTTQNGNTPSFVFGDLTPITCRLVQPSGSTERPWADIDLTNQEVHVAIGTPGSYPTAGTFTLTYGANTTTALAFDASAATVAAALNLLASIIAAGGVSVTSAAGGSYRIVFSSVGARTAITTNTSALYPTSTSFVAVAQTGSASVQEVVVIRLETQPAAYIELTDDLPVAAATVTTVRAGSAGVSEIQKLTFDPIPYDGVFTLAYDGEETTDLAWDSTAEEIQAALIALTDVDTTGISVTGSFPTYTITFLSTYGNVSQLTVAADSLIVPTGKKGSISLNTTGVVEILSGATRADVTIEVQVVDTVTGDTWTTLQSPAILREDIIGNSPASQTAGPVYILESVAEARYVRYDAAQTLTAPNKVQAVTNLGFTTNKATIANGDKFTMLDSAASDAPKHTLWSLIVSTLTTAFNALYVGLTGNQTVAGNKTFSGSTSLTGGVAGNVDFDSSTLYVDSTNNRVGAGTSSPATPFHVVGSRTIDGMPCTAVFSDPTTPTKRVNIGYNTTSNAGQIQSVDSGVQFTNLIINPYGGSVGVGASPIAKFSISDDATYNSVASWGFVVSSFANTNYRVGLGYDQTNDVGYLQSVQEGTAFKRLTINPNGGNVGINKAAPVQALDVTGNIGTSGTIELGHASDTTLSRSAAGKLAVEGVDVVLASGTQTIAGDKTFSGASTFSGAVALNGNAKVSAYKSTDQTGLTTGVYNKITFDTEEYDTGSNFASSTFTAPRAGKYLVTVAMYANGTAGVDALAVYKNGSQHKRLNSKTVAAAEIVNGSVVVSCAANDTLEIYYFNQNARDILGASTITWLQVTELP